MDHVDECSCVGYTVSNFDFLSELWENTQIQISFKLFSFTVIIVCVYSYKLSIRCTFCINLMWYILFEGVVVSQWSSFKFHFVFWIWSSVSSCCWLRQCWSMWHFNIFYFSLQKRLIDPAASYKVQPHKQDFWRTNVYSSKACVPGSVNKI